MGGGAIFNFSLQIDLKTTKKVRAPPPGYATAYTAAILPKRDRGKRVWPRVSNRSAREIFTHKKSSNRVAKKVARVNAAVLVYTVVYAKMLKETEKT